MSLYIHWHFTFSEREREMFYLTTHSTHFIYGYMASDIWLRTILIVRKETRCRHIGYSYRLAARVLLYAPSHRQDNTYHGLCYTSRGALAGTRNSSMGPPHEGSIRRPSPLVSHWVGVSCYIHRHFTFSQPLGGGFSIYILIFHLEWVNGWAFLAMYTDILPSMSLGGGFSVYTLTFLLQ